MPSCARLIRSACLAPRRRAVCRAGGGTGRRAEPATSPRSPSAADLAEPGGHHAPHPDPVAAVEARGFVMERPDRAVIDLPEVNFQLDPAPERRREGLVQSFRYGLFAPGRSRIVIDLAGPATVGRIETATRPRDGAVLLTIPLQRVDREAFRKAAARRRTPPPPRHGSAAARARRPAPADHGRCRPWRHRSRRDRGGRRVREGHRLRLRPGAGREARGGRPLPGSR